MGDGRLLGRAAEAATIAAMTERSRTGRSRSRSSVKRGPALDIGRELVRRERWPLPDEPLPLPADTRHLIAARLGRWPPPAIEVLFVMAALSAPTVPAIAAALARPPGAVRSIIERAAAEDIVERDGTTRLHFAHPFDRRGRPVPGRTAPPAGDPVAGVSAVAVDQAFAATGVRFDRVAAATQLPRA